ncbi:MAG TPA: fused MFS/spermidine synthase [Candidatus Angelobacter sp.]|nr:fused MFS/spermidine synthase [Candidatus Angelobacter sp.]
MHLRPRAVSALVAGCVFASGAAGLAYEIVFARYLGLFLGHDGYAVVAVLVAFMGGLAIGNSWFGGKVDQRPDKALRFYAWLEIGIGLYALGFPAVHFTSKQLFLRLAGAWQPGGLMLIVLKFIFATLTILPPAILMGGTLPAVVRFATRSLSELRGRVASLYFTNSLGAVFGCLASDFWWIPDFGLPATLRAGAVVNLLVGILALSLSRAVSTRKERASGPSAAAAEESVSPAQTRLVMTGIAISGFAAMLYEVAWTRLLALTLGSTTHAFSLMLAAFIAGIAAGAWAIARWRVLRRSLAAFAQVEIVLGVVVFISLPLYSHLPYAFAKSAAWLASDSGAYPLYASLQGVLCFAVMFMPALLLGATLPLASRAAATDTAGAGKTVGRVFALNTLGAVVGTISTGLWLMPTLGLASTFGVGIAANLAAGAIICRGTMPSIKSWLIPAAAVFLFGVPWICGRAFDSEWQRVFTLGLWRQPRSIASLAEFKSVVRENNLKFYRDGVVATVSVNAWTEGGTEQLNLRVNGKPDASTAGDMPTQLLLGHLPMLLRPQSEHVLVVGLGSGVTCGAVARHASVKQVDAVEISPDVVAAARLFSAYNHQVLEDPRLRLTVDDARSFLQTTDQTYDAIISEPSNPWIAGVAGLFTREFFESCRARLRSDGLMAQWIHLYDNNQAALEVVMRTFSSVFPNVAVWQSEELDLILVGSARPWKADLTSLLARFDEADVRADLARARINRPAVLLSREIISQSYGRFLAAPAGPVQTDLKPVLEYLAQRAFFAHENAAQWLQLDENLSTHADTLLAEYLRSHPLTVEDYRAFAEFYFAYHLPAPELLRSLCLRWQEDPAAQGALIELLPRLPPLGTTPELEALRFTALRENLLARADKDPGLLRHYAKLLLQVYRSQRSVFYFPRATELQTVLERLLTADPANLPSYQLQLAELAWDRGDTEGCIRLSRKALSADNRSSSENDAAFARFAEALLLTGRRDEALESCRRGRDAGHGGPRLEMVARRVAASEASPRR